MCVCVCIVQSILVDRFFQRRELRLILLESMSNVEYEIKKFFDFPYFMVVIEV